MGKAVRIVSDVTCRQVSTATWAAATSHANGGKTRLQLSFGAGAPTDGLPFSLGQHVFGRYRENVRNVPLPRTAAPGNRPDHLHIGRIRFEVTRNAHRPSQFASRKPLAERRAQSVTGICQDAAKAYPSRNGAIDLQ